MLLTGRCYSEVVVNTGLPLPPPPPRVHLGMIKNIIEEIQIEACTFLFQKLGISFHQIDSGLAWLCLVGLTTVVCYLLFY